jgi:hypothetical protein
MEDGENMIIISQDTLDKNAHISNEEIERDILDTQREISELTTQIEGYEKLSEAGPDHERKMAYFRRDGAINGVRERERFIEKLQALLNARKGE